jgi:hypothetical protein
MKKQVSTGVLAGAQTFLGNGRPWGLGNQNQMATPLDPSVQKISDQEDFEINQNIDREETVLGKWDPGEYDYSFPATIHSPGAGPDNLTDLEKAAKEEEELDLFEQTGPYAYGSQRTPADQNYFDLPSTPKRMWFAKPENHVPLDRKEPYEDVEHVDGFLDDFFHDSEPLNTPNDYESTNLYQQGQLFTMPIDTNRLVLDNPKHPLKDDLEEQADPTRWYLRSASAKAITDHTTDTIRQETEPLLLGDPELDDDVVEMSPFSSSYLVKPRRWVKKEKDTDMRTLDDSRKKVTYEQIKRELNEISLKSIIAPIESWITTGNRNSFQTLMTLFKVAREENASGEMINIISQHGMRVATDAARRKRVLKLLDCIEE